jgi:uncharacterized membrane protein
MNRGELSEDSVTPARWPWWLALLSCVAGLVLSILLAQIHFKLHTNPAFHSFCAIDRTMNCDIVARSPYSVLFGVPVATWGIFGYAIAAVVALWGAQSPASARRWLWPLPRLLLRGHERHSGRRVRLPGHAVCILCLGTYAANILFLVSMLLVGRGLGLRAALAEPMRTLRARTLRSLAVWRFLVAARWP